MHTFSTDVHALNDNSNPRSNAERIDCQGNKISEYNLHGASVTRETKEHGESAILGVKTFLLQFSSAKRIDRRRA